MGRHLTHDPLSKPSAQEERALPELSLCPDMLRASSSFFILLASTTALRLPPLSRRSALGLVVAAPPLAASADGKVADRVGEDGRLVLKDANAASIDVLSSPPKVTSRCYLDISVGGAKAGRIVVDLFGELVPKTAENFRQLCSGEAGFGYAGSTFYKVLSDLTVQAGAIEGRGSIYGPTFPHENYDIKHNVAGMVSMVNSGVGGSSGMSDSRFLIQLADDAGYLDGRYVAFGRVTEGMAVVRQIENVRVSGSKKVPFDRVSIDAAGVLPPPAPPPAPPPPPPPAESPPQE